MYTAWSRQSLYCDAYIHTHTRTHTHRTATTHHRVAHILEQHIGCMQMMTGSQYISYLLVDLTLFGNSYRRITKEVGVQVRWKRRRVSCCFLGSQLRCIFPLSQRARVHVCRWWIPTGCGVPQMRFPPPLPPLSRAHTCTHSRTDAYSASARAGLGVGPTRHKLLLF